MWIVETTRDGETVVEYSHPSADVAGQWGLDNLEIHGIPWELRKV